MGFCPSSDGHRLSTPVCRRGVAKRLVVPCEVWGTTAYASLETNRLEHLGLRLRGTTGVSSELRSSAAREGLQRVVWRAELGMILLLQLDGKIPNLALMRIAAHHRALGDEVAIGFGAQFEASLWERPDKIYASAIFQKTLPLVQRLQQVHPEVVLGGTAFMDRVAINVHQTVESAGVLTKDVDYSPYPRFQQSIGFTQRGCRLKCSFCVVPRKEGRVRAENTIAGIWRGEPWPKELLLLDNDFFGQPQWRERITEIRDGGFKVSFNQGINCRCITDEAAEAIASVDYRDDSMTVKRIYTAWDSKEDEERLFAGLNRLVKYGVKPDHIMVYMLVGYWPGETAEQRDYRRRRLREFGARPYPMPYERAPKSWLDSSGG